MAENGGKVKGPKSSMSPRERTLAAIEGKPVDRVPVMYWINSHAGCKMLAEVQPGLNRTWNFLARRFWRRFIRGGEMDAKEIWRALPLLLQGYCYNDYVLELGADMAQVPYGSLKYWGKLYRENGRLRVLDVFGSRRGIGGIYLDVIEPGIKDIRDMVNYVFADCSGDEHYAAIRKYRAAHPEACIFTDNFGVQDLPTTQIWEMSKMMMAMIDYPDEVKAFQQRLADYFIAIGVRSIRAGSDIIFMYDDYGYTGRTLISMDMWREFTFPHLKRMIAAFHEEGAKVMLHSCGYQMPFLPYYVEAGLDVLQTFQPKAGNDFARAYPEYGGRLAFNTGIDIQLGEMMTADEFRRSIIESYRIGGKKGRHILGTTHMLQYTMPAANIRAMLETVREIQKGLMDG